MTVTMSGDKLFFLALSFVLYFVAVKSKECNQDPDSLCKCTFDDGSVIDITSLGNSDNTPRFADVLAQSEGNFYSYNPCYPFTEEQCDDAAVCIINPDKTQSITVGDAAKAAFKYDDDSGNVIAGYTSGTIKDLRLSEIILKCDQSACDPEITADGQQDQGFFQMTLTTVCACPDGCSSSGPKSCGSSGGISVGTILCILVLSIVVLYFVVGTVIMKFVLKKEGIEVIPNVVLWRSVPVLIKTGFLFMISKCRKSTSYEKI
ncbi:uncharacterized protein LOC123530760 [Mercenaria mercenaria]|uniref:uncharacterized protein LOC123530760 n=1 Tax=Mercenaria mercenaria TaxID=6596 RepID=UPI00234FA757|nr:uncharacterized protein LOC123530760 [Mercenaria mercenaria]